MIEIKLEGTPYQIPNSWDEVTVRQYDELSRHAEKPNPVRVLSVLTGLDYDTLNNFDCGGFEVNVMPALSFLGSPFELSTLPRKTHIKIRGVAIPVITDPGRERIGQKLLMTTLLSPEGELTKTIPEIMADVVANYYAPKIHPDGKWVEEHVAEIRSDIYESLVVDIVPECNFFLLGYIKDLKTRRSPMRFRTRIRR